MQRDNFNRMLGIALKRARNRTGLSQDDLADRTGISRGFISDVERGAKGLSLLRFMSMYKALDEQGDEIFADIVRRFESDEN